MKSATDDYSRASAAVTPAEHIQCRTWPAYGAEAEECTLLLLHAPSPPLSPSLVNVPDGVAKGCARLGGVNFTGRAIIHYLANSVNAALIKLC